MKICYFQHIDDANKYIKKYKLKKGNYTLEKKPRKIPQKPLDSPEQA